MNKIIFIVLLAVAAPPLARVPAQEQIDKADARPGQVSPALATLTMRLRVTQCDPAQARVRVTFRRGGEGLGGSVVKGEFASESQEPSIPLNAWSAWTPLKTVAGNAKGWEFVTVVAGADVDPKDRKAKAVPLTDVAVDFEFAENGKTFHQFTERGPKGATVGFVFPGKALLDKVTPDFVAQVNGIAGHARLRRERLEKAFPEPATMPGSFLIIGHVEGYGEA